MSFEEKKAKQLRQTKERVRMILEDFPETRNNDSLLTVVFLQQSGIYTFGELVTAASRQTICFESVRRARQMIQAAGQFLPTDESVIRRRRLQTVWENVTRKGTEG